jgi:hypothetical protein
MEHVEYVYTTGMTEDEVQTTLEESSTVVLALAEAGNAYAVPVNCHYDGEVVHLRLTDDGESRKLAYLDATESACLLWYGVEDDDSWSVIATGNLAREPDLDDATINEWFPPVRVFDESIEDVRVEVYAFEPRELTARRTVG